MCECGVIHETVPVSHVHCGVCRLYDRTVRLRPEGGHVKLRNRIKNLEARQEWFVRNVDESGHAKRQHGSDPPNGVYHKPGSLKK